MITLASGVPHRAFLEAMLARHFDPDRAPTVLVTTDAHGPVAASIRRVILIGDGPSNPPGLPTLVVGPAPAPGCGHARLATAHPAELLSVIDGYVRHPERYAAGQTTVAVPV